MRSRIWQIWTSLVYLAFGAAVFIGVSMQIAQAVASALHDVGSTVAVLSAGMLAVIASELWTVRFLGPARASRAELVWKPIENRNGRQRFQALSAALSIDAVTLTLLGLTAYDAKVPTSMTVGLATALLILSAGIVPYAALCQRLPPQRLHHTASVCIAGAMAILGAAAVRSSDVVPLILTGITLASGLVCSLWTLMASRTLRNDCRLVPRWELMQANAKVDHVCLSVMDLDASHYHNLSDANDRSRRRTLHLASLPKPVAMCVTVLARSWNRQWKMITVVVFLTIIVARLCNPTIGSYLGLVGCTVLALRASDPWIDWNETDLPRRLFEATVPAASIMLLSALLTPIVMLAALTGALGDPSLAHILSFAFIGLCGAIFTILGRADAARKRQVEGMTATLATPEMGVIMIGPIRAMVAGWVVASALVLLYLNTPGLPMLTLTGIVTAFSIIRAIRNSTRYVPLV